MDLGATRRAEDQEGRVTERGAMGGGMRGTEGGTEEGVEGGAERGAERAAEGEAERGAEGGAERGLESLTVMPVPMATVPRWT